MSATASSTCARSVGLSSPIPALFERMSTVCHSDTTRAKRRSTCALSATSVGTASAVPPASAISAATRDAPSGSTSSTATRAPSAAKRRAIAAPIPEPPPVTTATRPASLAIGPVSICSSRVPPALRGLPGERDPHALGADDTAAEIVRARLLVGDDLPPRLRGNPALPEAAEHRVPAGPVAVEVVEVLPEHRVPRRPAEAFDAVPGEERAERVLRRVEGEVRVPVRLLHLGARHPWMTADHVLRVVLVEVPVGDRILAHGLVVVFRARQRGHDEERREVDAHVEKPLGGLAPALGAVEREPDHVAAVDRDPVAVPVVAHAAILLLHRRERARGDRVVLYLPVLLREVLDLRRGEQVLRVERLEADERRVAARLRGETEEPLALLALARRLLAR